MIVRIITFVDTFGKTQPQLLAQFQSRVQTLVRQKDTLRIQRRKLPEAQLKNSDMSSSDFPPETTINPSIINPILVKSPSILFKLSDIPLCFGPAIIQASVPQSLHFSISCQNCPENCAPILQITSSINQAQVQSMQFQIQDSNTRHSIQFPSLYMNLDQIRTAALDQSNIQINVISIYPNIPIICMVRFLEKRTLDQVASIIRHEFPVAPPRSIAHPRLLIFCPHSGKLIHSPVRGVNCKHGECFDLTGFLSEIIEDGQCLCPICHIPLRPDDLRIDPNYMKAILGFA